MKDRTFFAIYGCLHRLLAHAIILSMIAIYLVVVGYGLYYAYVDEKLTVLLFTLGAGLLSVRYVPFIKRLREAPYKDSSKEPPSPLIGFLFGASIMLILFHHIGV